MVPFEKTKERLRVVSVGALVSKTRKHDSEQRKYPKKKKKKKRELGGNLGRLNWAG